LDAPEIEEGGNVMVNLLGSMDACWREIAMTDESSEPKSVDPTVEAEPAVSADVLVAEPVTDVAEAVTSEPAEDAAVTKPAAVKKSTPVKKAAPAKKAAPKKAKKAVPAKKAAPVKKAEKVEKPAVAPKKAKKAKPTVKKAAAKKAAVKKPSPKAAKTKPAKAKIAKTAASETAKVLDSKVVYEGKLFRVLQDHILEPDGRESRRDVIRHNGSVVILATNPGKKKKDPWVVIERQYRHAAGQYLWELPAGKLDAGESALEGAKRELAEETGYAAQKWTPLVEYYASPGFLGEAMKVFLAEGLVAGEAHPEADEHIDFRLVKLSEILEMIDKGKIIDGKTLTSILIYARNRRIKVKK
jgi:ADP-ribose pyrophosphatase